MSKNALFKWRFKLLNAVLNFLSLLRSRNFATIITWRCTSLLYRHFFLRLERTPGWNWWKCFQDAVKLCDVSCKLIWTLSLGFWSDYEDSHREDPIRLYVIFTVQIRSKATMVRKGQNAKRCKATCILIFSLTTNFLITKSCLSRNNTETSCEEHVKL